MHVFVTCAAVAADDGHMVVTLVHEIVPKSDVLGAAITMTKVPLLRSSD